MSTTPIGYKLDHMKKLFALLLAVPLICSCVSKTKYMRMVSDYESRIDEMEWQLHELEDDKNDLEDRVDELEDQVVEMEDIISEAKSMCLIWSDDAYMALNVLNQY